MLKRSLNSLKSINVPLIFHRNVSKTVQLHEKWDLITAVCIERKPIITPELNQLEKDFKKYLESVEFENSLKSDHEIRHEKEVKQLEKLKQGEEIEVHLNQTAQDLVDAATDELKKFQFASRITVADQKNDVQSLQRKLDRHLVLLMQQKIGKDVFYLLPQSIRQDGETLRQTAERVVKETCGDQLKARFYGNAPSSFYKYKYPKSANNEAVGAKVFIYFARYLNGDVTGKSVDYKWLDRNELSKVLPSDYQKSVMQMLIDE